MSRLDRPHFYILDGHKVVPIEDRDSMRASLKWSMWREKNDHIVKQTWIGGETILVSTVFLGLDHQFGDGPPLVFETMVFFPEAEDQPAPMPSGWQSDFNYGDRWMDRASTWEEAEAMHAEGVQWAEEQWAKAQLHTLPYRSTSGGGSP